MKRLLIAFPVILLALIMAAPAEAEEPREGSGPVWIIELDDTINPGSTEYLKQGLIQAAQADASLIIIQLDTPGGLVDSMRAMVKDIMACPAPVVVYVAPAGARAASAGAFIALAAPLAAMAPATNIGAAHPVGAGGKEIEGSMGEKVVQDLTALARSLAKRRGRDPEIAAQMVTESKSLDAGQALKAGIVDLIARDLGHLISQVQGKLVQTGSGKARIATAGKPLEYHKPGTRMKLLSFLANPNLAYILMMIGMAGLFFELSHPGSIFPGVVGGISLILALFAMSTLPVSYTGLALIGLSIVMFIAEIKITSGGLLTAAGALSLVLGSVMLFDSPGDVVKVSLTVMIPTVTSILAFFIGVTYLAMRAQMGAQSTGSEGLVGETAVVVDGSRVRIMGELWNASGPEPLEPGQEVVVINVEGLNLIVEKTSSD